MWTSRLVDQSEREAFDRFVARAPKGHILQSYEWGDIKAPTGWRPFRMVVEEDGRIVAAVSLLKRQIPVISKAIFYAPRGPVLDTTNQGLFHFLMERVAALARQEGVILLKVDPDIPVDDKDFAQVLQDAGFQPAARGEGFEGVQPRYVFRLDITPPEEQLLANLHTKTRYNLRMAEKRGVSVRAGQTKEDLRRFYDILLETAERDRFLIRGYDYFERLWDELLPRGYARLFMADYQGQAIAGTLAFIFGRKAWYIYGASSNQHRNVMPNYLLQWTMIRWARENGCTIYDFRGVPGHVGGDHPLYGLYRFKKGFNGQYVEFIGEFDRVYAPLYYRLWKTMEPIYSTSIRKLISIRKRLRGHPSRKVPGGGSDDRE